MASIVVSYSRRTNVDNEILTLSAKKEKLIIVNKITVYKGSATMSHGGMSLDHPAIDGLSNTPPQDEENKERGSL